MTDKRDIIVWDLSLWCAHILVAISHDSQLRLPSMSRLGFIFVASLVGTQSPTQYTHAELNSSITHPNTLCISLVFIHQAHTLFHNLLLLIFLFCDIGSRRTKRVRNMYQMSNSNDIFVSL